MDGSGLTHCASIEAMSMSGTTRCNRTYLRAQKVFIWLGVGLG